jgi:ABC-2 type transport system permease protein
LAAATLARNQAQVGLMTLLVVGPILLLSGLMAPVEAMPEWVRQLMMLSPLSYFIEITHGILLKGAGLSILWYSALKMALLGAALFGFGMWRFRRQFE